MSHFRIMAANLRKFREIIVELEFERMDLITDLSHRSSGNETKGRKLFKNELR